MKEALFYKTISTRNFGAQCLISSSPRRNLMILFLPLGDGILFPEVRSRLEAPGDLPHNSVTCPFSNLHVCAPLHIPWSYRWGSLWFHSCPPPIRELVSLFLLRGTHKHVWLLEPLGAACIDDGDLSFEVFLQPQIWWLLLAEHLMSPRWRTKLSTFLLPRLSHLFQSRR